MTYVEEKKNQIERKTALKSAHWYINSCGRCELDTTNQRTGNSEKNLLDRLTEIWYRHSLHEVSLESMEGEVVPPVPKIICGELM